DAGGRESIEMVVENLVCERELTFGISEFLSGQEPIKKDNVVTMGVGALSNPCSSLFVKCPNGTFRAESKILYSVRLSDTTTMRFHPLRSHYDEEPTTSPTFWVIPLQNFISRFVDYDSRLEEHPLRIQNSRQPTRPVDDRLIVFDFNGHPAFIERLPD